MTPQDPNSQQAAPKRRDSRIKQKDVVNSRSPGPKNKIDRLIIDEVRIDLHENLDVIMNFWAQPTLKNAFVQACQFHRGGPLVPAEVLRDLMVEFVKNNPPDPTELARQRQLREQQTREES